MKIVYQEKDPQNTLSGDSLKKDSGATVVLSGKGKHFDEIRKQLDKVAELKGNVS